MQREAKEAKRAKKAKILAFLPFFALFAFFASKPFLLLRNPFLKCVLTSAARPKTTSSFKLPAQARRSMVKYLYLPLRREYIALNWLLKIYCAKGRNGLSAQW